MLGDADQMNPCCGAARGGDAPPRRCWSEPGSCAAAAGDMRTGPGSTLHPRPAWSSSGRSPSAPGTTPTSASTPWARRRAAEPTRASLDAQSWGHPQAEVIPAGAELGGCGDYPPGRSPRGRVRTPLFGDGHRLHGSFALLEDGHSPTRGRGGGRRVALRPLRLIRLEPQPQPQSLRRRVVARDQRPATPKSRQTRMTRRPGTLS